MRTTLSILAILALAACASTPPAPGMAITPVACDPSQNPYGCEAADYSDSYGTGYAAYPVLVPVYPIAVAPPPPPVKPPPPPPPPPPPKIRVRPPIEKPCPKGGTSCP